MKITEQISYYIGKHWKWFRLKYNERTGKYLWGLLNAINELPYEHQEIENKELGAFLKHNFTNDE